MLTDCPAPPTTTSSVIGDALAAEYAALNEIIEQGRRRALLLSSEYDFPKTAHPTRMAPVWVAGRQLSYMEAMRALRGWGKQTRRPLAARLPHDVYAARMAALPVPEPEPEPEPESDQTAREVFLEDLEWLLDSGETCRDVLAERLGCASVRSFERRLYRMGRPDLLVGTHSIEQALKEHATSSYGLGVAS